MMETMTTISHLPKELLEQILSRVPISCLRAVRSTCKGWNDLSKGRIICKAETRGHEFVGFMMKKFKVCSMRFDLSLGADHPSFSIKELGNLVNHQVEISTVLQCDGLVLCATRDSTMLVVWNPYLGQTRFIEPRSSFHRLDNYAIGYDNNRQHKILRFVDCDDVGDVDLGDVDVDDVDVGDDDLDDDDLYDVDLGDDDLGDDDLGDDNLDDDDVGDVALGVRDHALAYEIYDLCTDSWRVLDITPKWDIESCKRGASLKGNTFFFAKEKTGPGLIPADHLLCFDFTTESFGQFLPLPFQHDVDDAGALSTLRDEKLAALFNCEGSAVVEIWVTSKIQPDAVSWIPFFKVDMEPFAGFRFGLAYDGATFFIDEDKKLAVVFHLLDGSENLYESDRLDESEMSTCYDTAYIIGENGYIKQVTLDESLNFTDHKDCCPLVCSSSYVPSLVQINQIAGGKKEEEEEEEEANHRSKIRKVT